MVLVLTRMTDPKPVGKRRELTFPNGFGFDSDAGSSDVYCPGRVKSAFFFNC